MFGARLYLDLIGPVHPDFSGNIHLVVARDEGSEFAFVVPTKDKSGTTVTATYKAMIKDAVIVKVRPDWGKEFQ